jgi:hypothetical protein
MYSVLYSLETRLYCNEIIFVVLYVANHHGDSPDNGSSLDKETKDQSDWHGFIEVPAALIHSKVALRHWLGFCQLQSEQQEPLQSHPCRAQLAPKQCNLPQLRCHTQ